MQFIQEINADFSAAALLTVNDSFSIQLVKMSRVYCVINLTSLRLAKCASSQVFNVICTVCSLLGEMCSVQCVLNGG